MHFSTRFLPSLTEINLYLPENEYLHFNILPLVCTQIETTLSAILFGFLIAKCKLIQKNVVFFLKLDWQHTIATYIDVPSVHILLRRCNSGYHLIDVRM